MSENTIEVQPLAADHPASGSQTLAVLAEEPAELDVLSDVLPSGRAFTEAGEPLDAGTAYPALDGTVYYRPSWRVAERGPGLLAGPDVWFSRDTDGTIGLRWTLADVPPPDAPADAWSLVVGVDRASVVWHGGSQEVSELALQPRVDRVAGQPGMLVRGATQLLPDQARALELAMSDASSGCRLEVTCTIHYEVQVQQQAGPPRLLVFSAAEDAAAMKFKEFGFSVSYLDDGGTPYQVVEVEERYLEQTGDLLEELGIGWTPRETLDALRPALIGLLGEYRVDELTGGPVSSQRESPITQAVPFVFNPNDDANRPIYRALHGAANLTGSWQKSAAGWLRAAPFPATVYRIPDEVRLAFDPDLGTPHVVATLYAGGQGSAVRVLLRVAPWQDPRKVAETRALTRGEATQVIVGPVESAALRLGGSFPEGVRIIGAAGRVPISIAGGADLLMDLSLEYFQLLSDALGGAVGLPGDVEVRLGDGDGTVSVPVSLRMDRVDDLPVGVEVQPPAAGGPGGSPTAVRVTNRSGTAIRIGGCAATFLQLDRGTVVPMANYPARCTSAFPIELAPGGAADLTFEPADPHDGDRWNAVLVDLLDKTMVDDARTTLLKVHRLAGGGELTWDLTISSPVFAAPTVPTRWAELSSLEVEISAPGFETTTVVLRRDTPARTLTMRTPLSALVAGAAAGIRTATYRVRNNYLDHQGQWTAPQQQSGEELIIFPNPTTPD